jgi:hypothetical protein
MKHIRNFDGYRKQKQLNESYNQKVLLLHDVQLGKDDEELFKNIFEKVLANSKISDDIRNEIRNYIAENEMLNEGFFDKLKERFPKAAEVSKALSDKAEATLGSILNKVKDAVSFVKKLSQGIKEFFMAIFEKGKKFFTEQIQGGKLKGKIDELTKTKKEGLVTDLKTIKEVTNFYRKDFMSKLLASKEKNMTDFLSKEQEPIAEAMLTEGKNVIATLVHGVEKIPPFSWLHKVAQVGEAGAATLVKAISGLTQKLGGPAFELPVVVLLVGIVIEQMIKDSAGHWLIDLAGSATPLGMAIKGVQMVAFFVALIVALDATIGEKILGGHGDHGHGEEHGEKKEEAKSEGETETEGKPEEVEAKPAEGTETK